MTNFCWKCHKEAPSVIHFKSTCDHCSSYLHCCLGCRFHTPGKPNECHIPGTETIRDREANNYCDDFKPITHQKIDQGPSVEDISKRLFGD